MRTIGFINWKGGVGKTTISINTAFALAQEYNPGNQIKLLFIDADKQGNASRWFGADTSKGSLTDILLTDTPAKEVIQHTRYPNIDIIPADASLIQANYAVLGDQSRRQDNILKESLESVKNEYALCIIDNPPDSNLPVLNCLEVIDDLIAVTLPNRFSVDGVYELQNELDNYNRDLQLSLFIRGVIINQYTPFNSPIFHELRDEHKYHLFPFIRGGNCAQHWLDKCINEQKSIFEVSSRSGYAQDLKRFIQKLGDVIMADENHTSVIW